MDLFNTSTAPFKPAFSAKSVLTEGGGFQADLGGFSWLLVCANVLMFIQIESRKAGLSRMRDVGVAGPYPVIPTKKISEIGGHLKVRFLHSVPRRCLVTRSPPQHKTRSSRLLRTADCPHRCARHSHGRSTVHRVHPKVQRYTPS